MKERKVLSVEDLKEILSYCPESGIFKWKIANCNRVKVGSVAGYLDDAGYTRIGINGKFYRAHRLAWLYMTGKMPVKLIDHKDEIRHHNWFDNLREANKSENAQNQTNPMSNNTTGYLGVSPNKPCGKYRASIRINGKTKYLGLYSTPEEASAAYVTEKQKIHPFSTI